VHDLLELLKQAGRDGAFGPLLTPQSIRFVYLNDVRALGSSPRRQVGVPAFFPSNPGAAFFLSLSPVFAGERF